MIFWHSYRKAEEGLPEALIERCYSLIITRHLNDFHAWDHASCVAGFVHTYTRHLVLHLSNSLWIFTSGEASKDIRG